MEENVTPQESMGETPVMGTPQQPAEPVQESCSFLDKLLKTLGLK